MTKKQTIELFAILVAAYPNFDKFKDEEQVAGMVNVWANIFADDDAAIVGMATKKHIATSKWPPSIAEIRDIMTDITHPDLIPPDLAWAAVSDLLYSLSEYGSYNFYALLPPLVARVVETIGWHTLRELHRGSYAGNKDGMDRVAFMDLYKPAYDRARAAAACPASLSAGINATAQKLSDGGVKMLEAATEKRREQDRYYEEIATQSFRRMITASENKAALIDGETTEGSA